LCVARDRLWLEAVEGAAEVLALAQDGDPRQPGLEAVEHQLLVERAVVVFRHAPLLVVVGDVERIFLGPRTALEAVGVQDGVAHCVAFAPAGQAKRAQLGLRGCSATPPAVMARPAACASATRSSRSSARPCPAAEDPMVPSGFSAAVTAMPAS